MTSPAKVSSMSWLTHFSFQRKNYQALNTITLSRSALQHNYHLFQTLNPHLALAPVLKSNAYGHGLTEIAKMTQKLKPPFLVVDSLYEAYELLKAKIKTPILIMGFTHPANFTVKKLPFSTVVYDLETIETLYTYQPQMSLHLKVDTGMNRQGVRYDELADFLEELKRFPNLKIEGVASHLSDADNQNSDLEVSLPVQIERFEQSVQLLEQYGYQLKWKHLSATAGALKVKSDVCNMVRLGIGLYGISPLTPQDPHFTENKQKQLQPVMQFETSIAQIKKLLPGETTGYNNTFTATREMTIGILPAGYYDGLDRRLSNQGSVAIDGIFCPILGRISMNITVIDISRVHSAHVGQKVVVYSKDSHAMNSIAHCAELCQTIPYELLVHLAPSVKRVVVT
jgi:alanine racemase